MIESYLRANKMFVDYSEVNVLNSLSFFNNMVLTEDCCLYSAPS